MWQERVKEEWKKFISGGKVNHEIISPMIYNSWQRSKEYGVDPYGNIEDNILMDDAKVEELTDCSDLLQEYGRIIEVIREIAAEMGLICNIRDKQARTKKISKRVIIFP